MGCEKLDSVVGLHGAGVAEAVESGLVGVELDDEPVAVGVVVFGGKLVEFDSGYCWHSLAPVGAAPIMGMDIVGICEATEKDTNREHTNAVSGVRTRSFRTAKVSYQKKTACGGGIKFWGYGGMCSREDVARGLAAGRW